MTLLYKKRTPTKWLYFSLKLYLHIYIYGAFFLPFSSVQFEGVKDIHIMLSSPTFISRTFSASLNTDSHSSLTSGNHSLLSGSEPADPWKSMCLLHVALDSLELTEFWD